MRRCASFILAGVAVACSAIGAVSPQHNAAAGLEKLKSLVGEWQSKNPDGGITTIRYQLMSGGSALMETLIPAGEPDMVSVYHLDGAKLIANHFCSAGNQPRMQADVPPGEIKALNFKFVDASNLASPSEGHIHNVVFTFKDNDHWIQTWTWRQDGKDMLTTHNFERKR
jgi:hypothetical protein